MSDSYPRVLAVGDRAMTVELGASLDQETVGRVRALDLRLRDRGLPGILETVPTYAALMVLYDRRRLSFAELREALLQLARGLEASVESGRLVEIPALYDGEDLAEVAAAGGLKEEAVVELHSGQDYSVLMLGFSPGFAYMGFVDERLRRPRRKTPRTRVPGGAIGVAGAQTGIYPRALPGGWNLLGRTSLRLFDASAPLSNRASAPLSNRASAPLSNRTSPLSNRPSTPLGDPAPSRNPSLLMPGDRVRFIPATSLEPMGLAPRTNYAGHGVRVVDAGMLTTVQDAGRPGLRRVAVPLTGYADPAAARVANACVGNPPDAPVIEVWGPGLRLHFERATFIAITGARVTADLERADLEGGRMAMPMNVAVRVRASNQLAITGVEDGVRAYVAIAGMEAPQILGSGSVDLGSGFLRPLEAGDRLCVGAFDSDRVRREPTATLLRTATVRVILGPQLHHFDEATIQTFLTTPWRVGLDSDRVGARLDGLRLSHSGLTEIVSDGMVPGCIQVPPDGRPIVMLSDCPTTGGYPKIACVVSDDLGVIAQAVPGRTVIHWRAVGTEDL